MNELCMSLFLPPAHIISLSAHECKPKITVVNLGQWPLLSDLGNHDALWRC